MTDPLFDPGRDPVSDPLRDTGTAPESTVPPRWREASRDELDRHWQAGTLSPAEHERRTTAVRTATTTAQLEEALTGLPPLPDREEMLPLGTPATPPGSSGAVGPGGPGGSMDAARPDGAAGPTGSAPSPVEPPRGGLPPGVREAAIIASVFAAILLSSTTGHYVWWLLIPFVSVLVGRWHGSDASRERRRERRREIHRYRRGE